MKILKVVYVKQPLDFEDTSNPNHVFKLKKVQYNLKQALSSWHERFNNFLLKNGFERGKVDNTLFKKECNKDFLIVQVYVDDIIFDIVRTGFMKGWWKKLWKFEESSP